ncbi:MAG: hypothetical protein M1546_21480 [Chloroflexi bacterium]|nr:hypothetical protein [Chloroflexota bacterium]
MNGSFAKLGGLSAVIVGVLSVLYAVFFLVIARQAEFIGTYGSWLILGLSGLFSSAAYVALYEQVRGVREDNAYHGYALWAMLMGVGASIATLLHGVYQAMLVNTLQTAEGSQRAAIEAARMLPSQVDPAGLASFFLVGIVAFVFGVLIVRGGVLPRGLGYLGMFNAALLVILFFASASNAQTLILLSGGLTSVVVGPVWWVWLGLSLRGGRVTAQMPQRVASH